MTEAEREANRCPRCLSADTVGYWDKVETDTGTVGAMTHMLKHYYPNARKCIDCGKVYW